jgi:beta-glucosidase-like glycosyl hydrolase
MKPQLGHLLMIEAPTTLWSSALERLLERFRPSGLFFCALGTPTEAAEVNRKSARTLGLAPILALAEMGSGSLSRMLGLSTDYRTLSGGDAEKAGELIGAAMRCLGLNVNRVPLLNLPSAPSRASRPTPTGEARRPAQIAAEAAEQAQAFVNALARHGVQTCGGGFPAIATASQTSGPGPEAAPVVSKTMTSLWSEDLAPFRKLRAKLAMVEITAAICKAYDYEFPRLAPLSPNVVDGLLRVKLGYEGVALADVSIVGARAGISPSEAATSAIAAGCDLLLVPNDTRQVEMVASGLARALEFGTLATGRVDQALERVGAARRLMRPAAGSLAEREWNRLPARFKEFGRRFKSGEAHCD